VRQEVTAVSAVGGPVQLQCRQLCLEFPKLYRGCAAAWNRRGRL